MENTFNISSSLLVDDHALFRASLGMLLQHRLGISNLAEAASLQEAEAILQHQTYDVIFLDYHLPTGDALATGTRIKQQQPAIKLIYLTGTQSAQVLAQLVATEADGVLHKELSPEELQEALSTIGDGGQAISQQILDKLPPEPSLFTPREFQLFNLLARGLVTKQIADEMNISIRTAEKHRENLFKKAQVKNLAQLIELGYKWQILDLEAGA